MIRIIWISGADWKLPVRSAPERAELEPLRNSRRRGVLMPPCIDQFKAASKRRGQTGCVVAADDQAAASLRAVGRERADDHAAAGFDRSFQARDVGGLVGGLGQEVKR